MKIEKFHQNSMSLDINQWYQMEIFPLSDNENSLKRIKIELC